MKQWSKIRTLELGPAQFRSPEVHFLDGAFWLTLGYFMFVNMERRARITGAIGQY